MKKSQLKAIIRECIEEMDEGIVDTVKKGYHKVAAGYHGKMTDRDYAEADTVGTPMRTQLKKVKSGTKHYKAYKRHTNASK